LKAQIEAGLRPLIGLPLIGSNRAADMEMFSFGDAVLPWAQRGKSGLRSRYGLHVQCPWRIVRSGAIVTGYDDIGEPNRAIGESPDFDPNELGQTLREELLVAFYEECRDRPRIVIAIEATDIGDLRVALDGDCVLEVFPAMSSSAAAFTNKYSIGEHWRFIDLLGGDVVIGRDGLDVRPPLTEP
jgi:hypothetical protein